MRFLHTLGRQLFQWIIGEQTTARQHKRRMLLERLQSRVLLTGIPSNDSWTRVSGALLDSDSSGDYIQLSSPNSLAPVTPQPTSLFIASDNDFGEGEDADGDATTGDSTG